MKRKRVCKAEQFSSDIISTLPQTILENILSLLPTHEAARTSILAREWRYKWTKIPKLDFCMSEIYELTTEMKQKQRKERDNLRKLFRDLLKVLLLHKGSIHEFSLFINMFGEVPDFLGFNRVILHLSKYHTIKKLTLKGSFDFWYKLPVSVFSMHCLTDLELSYFDIAHQPTFNGFGCLRSLVLSLVHISTKTLLHLLSNSPSLKSLALYTDLEDKCTIWELFECLPAIEHFTISSFILEWFVLDSVPKQLSTLPFHIKYFTFEQMCLAEDDALAFLRVLIKCSPNLEKIKLTIGTSHVCSHQYSLVWEEYTDVWLEHLNELEIERFRYLKHEMEFVKFILARAPNLKKVNINSGLDRNQETEMLRTLLRAPRASPV